MKELSQGKTKVAVGKEEEQTKRPKRDKSVKADKKDPAPATLSPAPAKLKSGKGAHTNEARPPGKGGNPAGDATKGEQSVYHCYWFHHADGCKRTDCKFKHDKRIPKKELEDLKARKLDQKRSSSAPPAAHGEKGNPKGGGKKICYEFRKSGACLKGQDCAYEHVAAAEAKGPKAKVPQQEAFGTPAISIFDLDDGNFCLAVGESYCK
jgi:hypothetical protein